MTIGGYTTTQQIVEECKNNNYYYRPESVVEFSIYFRKCLGRNYGGEND